MQRTPSQPRPHTVSPSPTSRIAVVRVEDSRPPSMQLLITQVHPLLRGPSGSYVLWMWANVKQPVATISLMCSILSLNLHNGPNAQTRKLRHREIKHLAKGTPSGSQRGLRFSTGPLSTELTRLLPLLVPWGLSLLSPDSTCVSHTAQSPASGGWALLGRSLNSLAAPPRGWGPG